MFAVSLRRFFYVSDKIIVRNLRSRKFTPANPGLDRRIRSFKEEGIQVQDDDAEEFVEQSESDFYKVGEAYNEHLNETLIGKIQLRHQIVKEKYFKENMPNLLTWSEKEQIRFLAMTRPDEWTPERIAESFPVTAAVVKKLLKYPWKPATEQRIARHDASAMRNWRELREGTLDIPEDLRQHFLKFANRTIPPLNKKSIKVDITPEKDIGEFEKIIQRCAAKDENNQGNTKNMFSNGNENFSRTEEISKENPKKKDNKPITLDALTERVKSRLKEGTDINMSDKLMLSTIKDIESEITPPQLNYEVELQDVEKTDDNMLTGIKQDDKNVMKVVDYPLRIRIPKKAYKRGATYKVNDCYYDHDGRFLYRVIGFK